MFDVNVLLILSQTPSQRGVYLSITSATILFLYLFL